jgi:hypothetical protein
MPKRKRRAKPCPHCGSRNTTRIVYGLYAPGPEGMPDDLVLGGCTIFPGQPLRHCLDCDTDFEPREVSGEWSLE